MNYFYLEPNNSLNDFIRTVLVIEGFSSPNANLATLYTNAMPVLFCKTEKTIEELEQIVQLTLFAKSPTDIWSVNENETIIAYFFKPITQACVFNVSAKDLLSKHIDLSDLNPHKFNALKTQLIYATSTKRKIEVLDNLLFQQFQENQNAFNIIQFATNQLINDSNNETLSKTLKNLGTTERTFQRIFKKFLGITPTQFRRICQFQSSFEQLRDNQFDKLSEIAFDNGFADQSHFIRSFKEFTEITPNDYLKNGLIKNIK